MVLTNLKWSLLIPKKLKVIDFKACFDGGKGERQGLMNLDLKYFKEGGGGVTHLY